MEVLNDYFRSEKSKEFVKKVYLDFKIATKDNFSALFLYLICSILGKIDDITLTNCRTQLRTALEKHYLQFTSECNFDSISLDQSMWYQFSDIIIHSLHVSRIVTINKKLGPRKRKHLMDYISISEKFQSIAVVYDFKSSNMPLVSEPRPWVFSDDIGGVHGGFLVNKTDLIIYNKEKSLMTRIGDDILSNINYLQQIPYKINKKRLNNILSDLNQYLKDQGLRVHLYKNRFDFLNEDPKYNHTPRIYGEQLKEVRKIIETLEQSLYLINFPRFYFTMYLDFGTRTYYHGWPLNPQGDKLSRELLMFQNQRKKTVTKELDVSASGLQIIGGLLLDVGYLEKTNFIKRKNSSLKKKYDLYTEALRKYLSKKNFGNKKHEEAIRNLFTRKVFKSIIMCYFYNETHFGAVQKLTQLINFQPGVGFNINKEVTLIREFLQDEFKEYHFLARLMSPGIESSIKNQKALSLYKGNNIETFQYYALREINRVNYYDRFGKRQKISISADVDPLTLDKRKTRRATQPNFVHNIDSQILHSVIAKAKNEKIFLAVIHDCFIIHKKYETKIKKWYYESFNDLIFKKKSSILLSFLQRNLSEVEYENLSELLQELSSRQKDFSLENYEMSIHINRIIFVKSR